MSDATSHDRSDATESSAWTASRARNALRRVPLIAAVATCTAGALVYVLLREWPAKDGIRAGLVPLALAASSLSLAVGYVAAFLVELRRPTLVDVDEVLRIARQTGLDRTAVIAATDTAMVRRRAVDRHVPSILRGDPSAFHRIQLLLSTMGDAVTSVGVRAARAPDTAVAALHLAAAAAAASPAVLLIDGDVTSRRVAVLCGQPDAAGLAAVARGKLDLASALTSVATGRDRSVTLLGAGRTSTTRDVLDAVVPAVQRLMQRFDLSVVALPQLRETWPRGLQPRDIMLVVTPGATDVAWLRQSLLASARDGEYVRAVLVWTPDRDR
jgi:hypothetical protein